MQYLTSGRRLVICLTARAGWRYLTRRSSLLATTAGSKACLFFLLGFCTLQHFLTSDNSHHSPLGLSLGCQKEAQPQTTVAVCLSAVLLRCSKLMQPFLCTAAANKETKSWWSGWSLWSFWPSTKKDGNAQVRAERIPCARLSEQWDLSYFQAWQQQRLSFQRPNLLGDDLLCQDV